MAKKLFKVMVRHDHFPRQGEIVELDDEAQLDWAFSIEREFLVPVEDPTTVPAPDVEAIYTEPTLEQYQRIAEGPQDEVDE